MKARVKTFGSPEGEPSNTTRPMTQNLRKTLETTDVPEL